MRTLPPEWASDELEMTVEVHDGDTLIDTLPFEFAEPVTDVDPAMPGAAPWRWGDTLRYHYVDVTPLPVGDSWTWKSNGLTYRARAATPDEIAARREPVEA